MSLLFWQLETPHLSTLHSCLLPHWLSPWSIFTRIHRESLRSEVAGTTAQHVSMNPNNHLTAPIQALFDIWAKCNIWVCVCVCICRILYEKTAFNLEVSLLCMVGKDQTDQTKLSVKTKPSSCLNGMRDEEHMDVWSREEWSETSHLFIQTCCPATKYFNQIQYFP